MDYQCVCGCAPFLTEAELDVHIRERLAHGVDWHFDIRQHPPTIDVGGHRYPIRVSHRTTKETNP